MRAMRGWVAAVAGVLCVIALGTVTPRAAESQLGSVLRKKAEEAKKRADDAVKKKSADSAKAANASKGVDTVASPGTVAAPSSAAPAKADPKVWENYDFVPGSKILFFTDFSEDKTGNFARGLKYVGGPAEVVERDGVKMLRTTGRAEFLIPVGKQLPPRFTLEIDVLSPPEAFGGYDYVAFEGGPTMDRGDNSAEVNWAPASRAIIGGGQDISRSQQHPPESEYGPLLGHVTHLRVLMDSGYFKMYQNEKRIYNVPELQFKRADVIRVSFRGEDEAGQATFLTGIRLAESETDVMYDALNSNGRWSTQGILFETGKATLQPESRPVLKEIAGTMKKYGDLKVLIEGHTDNVGSSESNMSLSDARGAAVKAALVSDFGIDGSRITTRGLGDTKPAVPNTTASGRAQNRRVEVVKQ